MNSVKKSNNHIRSFVMIPVIRSNIEIQLKYEQLKLQNSDNCCIIHTEVQGSVFSNNIKTNSHF